MGGNRSWSHEVGRILGSLDGVHAPDYSTRQDGGHGDSVEDGNYSNSKEQQQQVEMDEWQKMQGVSVVQSPRQSTFLISLQLLTTPMKIHQKQTK